MSTVDAVDGFQQRIEQMRLIGLATSESCLALESLISLYSRQERFYVDHCYSNALTNFYTGGEGSSTSPGTPVDATAKSPFPVPGWPDVGSYTDAALPLPQYVSWDAFCGFNFTHHLDFPYGKTDSRVPRGSDTTAIWIPSAERIRTAIDINRRHIADRMEENHRKRIEACDETLRHLREFDQGLLY